ncbi:MAG: hypothetical protein AAF724_00750 [Pseudomonadota bacterium]
MGENAGLSGVATMSGRRRANDAGFARQRIANKAPEEIVFLNGMPLNATGKIDRVALKKRAAEDHAEIG